VDAVLPFTVRQIDPFVEDTTNPDLPQNPQPGDIVVRSIHAAIGVSQPARLVIPLQANLRGVVRGAIADLHRIVYGLDDESDAVKLQAHPGPGADQAGAAQ
jgi:hypothetical protein